MNVVVRSGFDEMKASPWEKEDSMREGIPIHNFLVPKSFEHKQGKLVGMVFEKVKAEFDAKGRRTLVPSGEPDVTMECDDVLVAVGQENAFPWIERDCGIDFDKWGMPVVDEVTYQSSNAKVFFGGAEEHHLGRRARAWRGDFNRSTLYGARRSQAAAAIGESHEPEDGHS